PPRSGDLAADLGARIPPPNDHPPPAHVRRRVPIRDAVDEAPPEDLLAAKPWSLGIRDDPRGDDHGPRGVTAARGGDPPDAVVAPHGGNGAARLHGEPE